MTNKNLEWFRSLLELTLPVDDEKAPSTSRSSVSTTSTNTSPLFENNDEFENKKDSEEMKLHNDVEKPIRAKERLKVPDLFMLIFHL